MSKALDFILFADDTNKFFSHNDPNQLMEIVNNELKNKNSFRLPYCRTNVRKFSLRFQGPKIFNSLSSGIQNASSTALFTSKLKSFFLGLSTL